MTSAVVLYRERHNWELKVILHSKVALTASGAGSLVTEGIENQEELRNKERMG